MNAEDMKINNLVEYKNQTYVISEIFQNNQKDYFVKIENDIQDLFIPAKNVKPIQITEEWLQKFGFSKIYKSDQIIRYERPEEFIKYDIELSSKKITEGLKIYGNLIKCKYIHEFQNIFSSLFGQESFSLNNPILSTVRS